MPNQALTKKLEDINKKDVMSAGGKGASLGEMIKAKIPVPSGFVVLTSAFNRFLEEADLLQNIKAQIHKIDYGDILSVERASQAIRDLINGVEIPADLQKEFKKEFKKLKCKFVAVRSSATAEDSSLASWAGELESYLNTSELSLLKNIKNCWSSLFTSRAIFYRKENNLLDTYVSVAVVVQKMLESEVSGITFTVHPVTKDKRQMIIESCYGLGEAIVSGSITPDSYVIDKKDWSIMDINLNAQTKMIVRGVNGGTKLKAISKAQQNKQILSGREIVELAKLCAKIEKHYRAPQDIEWAYTGGKFSITQSRPITTLK